MRWRTSNLKVMSVVMGVVVAVAPTLSLQGTEVVPNGTVTTYKHGGGGEISETYTPPDQYNFKKIHPGEVIEYFDWSPQDLFELTTWIEGAAEISIVLENPIDTPDLFIGTVAGELVTSGGSGGTEGNPITWEGQLRGIHIEMIKVPPKYYAQAESHVPLLIKVRLPQDDNRVLTTADVRLEYIYLELCDTVYGIGKTAVRLEAGNLYDRPVDTDAENTFTLIVDESIMDVFTISPDRITDDAVWGVDISVKANDGTWVRCGEYYDGSDVTGLPPGTYRRFVFGDASIPVYELTMGRIAGNGRYDVTQQPNYRQAFSTDFWGKTRLDYYYRKTSFYNWGHGPEYGAYGTPTATHTLMLIKYDTDTDNFGFDDDLRFAVADERRGGGVVFVEGRSTVETGTGTQIADVFDPTLNTEDIGFEYFAEELDGTEAECFTMMWGQGWELQREPDVAGWITWVGGAAATIGSLALCVVTAPVTGGGSVYLWVAGCVCADVGLVSLIMSGGAPNPTGKEWGTYIVDGAWSIQPAAGDPDTERKDTWSSAVRPQPIYINADRCDGRHPGWYARQGLGNPVAVQAGESLSGYVSGSVFAGSPSGTDWGVDYDLDVWLDLNIGSDKYIDILSNANN